MNWILNFLRSSIGRKFVMSLTGLFLILFLVVHLLGNLQLLVQDQGESFNKYAYFMTHNPVIKLISYGLYFFILLHTLQGILIANVNRRARSKSYTVNTLENASWASKNMIYLGLLIFAFLCIHMGDFWVKMKMKNLQLVQYNSLDFQIQDLYQRVDIAFDQWWIVLVYILGMIALALHLDHGFQSAFQTLGVNHKKYTPVIKFIGRAYSIIVSLGFAIIPVWMHFF